jgi:hypothetical protein
MTEQPGRLAAYWEHQLDKLDDWEEHKSRRLPGWRDRKHRRALTAVLSAADLVLVGAAAGYTKIGDGLFFGPWAPPGHRHDHPDRRARLVAAGRRPGGLRRGAAE